MSTKFTQEEQYVNLKCAKSINKLDNKIVKLFPK